MGPDILRGELRLPAEALGASGSGSGAGVYRGPPRHGGGPLSCKILLSGHTRYPDGAGVQADIRQTHLEADPRLSHRGGADRWAGRADGAGYAARRTAVAAVVEPDAGCAGQGTGEARPSLRALCR